jgi:endonuclease/exonuclease/phosphatase family metal-dependent hydrolase
MRTSLLVFTTLFAASACGGPLSEDELDDLASEDQSLATNPPTDRIVVWQQNIEGMKAGAVPASRLTKAMLARPGYRPDIVMMQEAWQNVLCGDYLNPEAKGNVELMNWKGSPREANGLTYSCRKGRLPENFSVLGRLGVKLWGGLANVGHARPQDDNLGSTSKTGVTVAWDKRRYVLEDAFRYSDADVPGCPATLDVYKRVAVLLRDTRRTTATGDDRLIAVASAHYGSACRGASNRYVAEEMNRRWGTFGGRKLALRIFGGDFNSEADTTSKTYVARRREVHPDGWYHDVVANTSWTGGKFLDAVAVANDGGSGESTQLCARWTYPNVASCVAKTTCSSTCTGFGIGGKLMRLDYLFVSNRAGTLPASRILEARTDDNGAGYSDHKAVYAVIAHAP